jgi:general secretion pathway protein D
MSTPLLRASVRALWVLVVLPLAMVVASCVATTTTSEGPGTGEPSARASAEAPAPAATPRGMRSEAEANHGATTARAAQPGQPRTQFFPGSGQFINPQATTQRPYTEGAEGDVTLNFDGANLVDVVKAILGDILGKNYAIDPKVSGQVTLQTSRPVPKGALISILEALLKMNGAELVKEQDLYRVVPAAEAAKSSVPPTLHLGGQGGRQVMVVPLRYIAAAEMQKVLKLVQPGEQAVQADTARNLLILAGSQQALSNMLKTVALFDVDQFKGMSFGLYRLNYVDVETMVKDLEKLFTSKELPVSGMVRFIPIERMNAIVAITPQKRYLEDVKTWIERLDHAELATGIGLYVYPVQNRSAASLAEMLQNLFGAGGMKPKQKQPAPVAPSLIPGMSEKETPAPTGSPVQPVGQAATGSENSPEPESPAPNAAPGADPATASAEVGEVRIIADEENNALIIMASGKDYAKIERTIRRLDVLPLQVLIEASIVEVILTDDLRYGLEWFFKNNFSGGSQSAKFSVPVAGLGGLPGFTYSLVASGNDIRVVLNALAEQSKVDVLSSPSLMVLDNRTAEIRVGNQQPITTETATTEGGVIIQQVQYKDTGVLLKVTPRVNVGGLVTMDISQEVTDVGQIDQATGQRSFLQRNVTSTVAVKSGQTVVLGGLITENDSNSESGIPILHKLPVVGNLFGTTTKTKRRNELVVLITPRVVENAEAATAIVEDFRKKMSNLNLRNLTTGTTYTGAGYTHAEKAPAPSEPAPAKPAAPAKEPGTDPAPASADPAATGAHETPAAPTGNETSSTVTSTASAGAGASAARAPPVPSAEQTTSDADTAARAGSGAGFAPDATRYTGAFSVQLAASSGSPEPALRAWSALRHSYPDLLSNLQHRIERTDPGEGKGVWYQLRVGPLPSEAAATRLCVELERRGAPAGCFAVNGAPQ